MLRGLSSEAQELLAASNPLSVPASAYSLAEVPPARDESSEAVAAGSLGAMAKDAAGDETEHMRREIAEAAATIAQQEPFLFRRMQQLVLGRRSLTDMLATVLARQLACADMMDTELYALLSSIFEVDASIETQMVADISAVRKRDPACPDHLHVLLNLKGFHALQTHRASHWLWQRNRKPLAFALANLASRIFGADIHPAARIGCGVMFDHGAGIVIGETAVVEDQVSILQEVTLGGTGNQSGDRHPKIRSGVMIGAGAKILGNIEIGTMSKVAAGSVVLRDVPPHCTVAGVPARVVRRHGGNDAPALEMRQTI